MFIKTALESSPESQFLEVSPVFSFLFFFDIAELLPLPLLLRSVQRLWRQGRLWPGELCCLPGVPRCGFISLNTKKGPVPPRKINRLQYYHSYHCYAITIILVVLVSYRFG